MHNGSISELLVQFVEYVKRTQMTDVHALRVRDLRLECRSQRLNEYGDWPMTELELIEQEAVGYGDDTAVSHVLTGEAQPASTPACWVNSPSPFAWT